MGQYEVSDFVLLLNSDEWREDAQSVLPSVSAG
jgi:hypothetical protein